MVENNRCYDPKTNPHGVSGVWLDQQKKRDTLSTETTLNRLRELQNCKVGGPAPEWMKVNEWGTVLSQLAGDAADLIEWYKSGKLPNLRGKGNS